MISDEFRWKFYKYRTIAHAYLITGPVVRIRPDVLHVNDPGFIEVLYTQSPKHRRERYKTVTNDMHAPGSVLATTDHDLHRKRRAVLNPYFSMQNVRRLEPIINQTVTDLLHRMDEWAKLEAPVIMNTAYRAATLDIIRAYAFGTGKKCLEMEDCNAAFFDIMTPQRVSHLSEYLYYVVVLMAKLPLRILCLLVPRMSEMETFLEVRDPELDEHYAESSLTLHNRD